MAYYVECVGGSLKGKRVKLRERKAVTFGRDRASTARIHDRKLSRIHCQFEIIDGDVIVSDLNSTNGTFVNGEKIDEVKIGAGDRIKLGRVTLVLIHEDGDSPGARGTSRKEQDDVPEVELAGRCEECGAPVRESQLDRGAARQVGERTYCAGCIARFTPRSAESEPDSPEPTPEEVETIDDDLDPGAELVGIRVLNKLGSGPHGSVYLAEQAETGRRVSLKILKLGSEESARKYLDTIYASGQLVHNNIVLLYDSGEYEGRFYVIREYVEGESLARLLEREGSVSTGSALNVIAQVAEALRHAKERSLSHGSVAPCNILLSREGAAKLNNFGIGSLIGADFPDPREDLTVLPYLSPEAVRKPGGQHGFPGDCYSIGAVFFHMITGQVAFDAPTTAEIRDRIQNTPAPRLDDYIQDLPHSAGQIVERCLDKMSSARYQQPKELLYDLEEVLRREL